MVTEIYFRGDKNPTILEEGELLTASKNDLGKPIQHAFIVKEDNRMVTNSPGITAAVLDKGRYAVVFKPQGCRPASFFTDSERSGSFWPHVEKIVHKTPTKK